MDKTTLCGHWAVLSNLAKPHAGKNPVVHTKPRLPVASRCFCGYRAPVCLFIAGVHSRPVGLLQSRVAINAASCLTSHKRQTLRRGCGRAVGVFSSCASGVCICQSDVSVASFVGAVRAATNGLTGKNERCRETKCTAALSPAFLRKNTRKQAFPSEAILTTFSLF